MSNRAAKEARVLSRGPLFSLRLGQCSVENLVENEDETRAQATGQNGRSLSFPSGLACACH